MKEKRSVRMCIALYAGIFLFLLVLNGLSPYITDDFRYCYSFHDDQRIESISQIIMSMRAHRYHPNGRLVSHSIVHFFSMFPVWIFDVVNSAMFVFLIALVKRISAGGTQKPGAARTGAVFLVTWLFCPAFGQVNLWQDGACNYLWSTVFALLFLWPITEDFMGGRPVSAWYEKACYLCLSFGMGAYLETVSAAAIGIAVLLLLLMRFWQRRKVQKLWLWSVAVATVGYISIYTAPAQLRSNGAEMTLAILLKNFLTTAENYWDLFGPLLCVFLVGLTMCVLSKVEWKKILLALVFFAGSLAANFIMMFANHYSFRSAVGAFLYLAVAVFTVIWPLLEIRQYKKVLGAVTILLVLVAIPALASGTADIWDTYCQIRENEAKIYACKEQGILDVALPVIETKTKYSEADGLVYLDTEDPTTWPNDSMARFYGLNSLIGIPVE